MDGDTDEVPIDPPYLVESVADNLRHVEEIRLNPDQVLLWKNVACGYEPDTEIE